MRSVKAEKSVFESSVAELVTLFNSGDERCSEQVDVLRQHINWQRGKGEVILGGLWLARSDEPRSYHERSILVLIGDHHFFRIELFKGAEEALSVGIESVPMGRLRSVTTNFNKKKDGDTNGILILDFAGPVFQEGNRENERQISFGLDSGWPGEELSAFLDALHESRK
ncbi:MAG: hypothetical protein KAI66_27490 [Lentisphaeria bacterium]|nr:hypothetical protein [Lentisphaeria bacterium]